ncbi:hypothetical protein [Methylobacterium sp. WSM2598]|uniref:hypothetical protein n=1 Tax=Methylobacterium sp. WSM2598 TaxID=398261 RepID=UPI0012F6AC84|nr:hypothetical protein [Methylobacterium sp. WSM2598]
MWSVEEPALPAWTTFPLDPEEILYEFDGPLTFTAKFGFFNALFHKVGQRRGSHFYIAVETSVDIISALKSGRISVRGALNRQHAWIIETLSDLSVVRYWQCSNDNMPERLLPRRGVSLYSYLGQSPNSVEQVNAFFSMAFVGPDLKSSSVPFSLLKKLINESYDAARRFLSPVFLSGAKSVTFDFPAKTVPGSLVLTLDEPIINANRLKQRTSDAPVSVEAARSSFARQRESFFDEVEELVVQASTGQVADSLAEERFSLLDNIQHIIPSDENRIKQVEFSGRSTSITRALVVDEKAGTTIHRAFKRVERQVVTETGRIEIVNVPSKYFVYRSTRGKQVACHIPADMFGRLNADGRILNGALVKVRGHLRKRPKRDQMITEFEPVISDSSHTEDNS